MEFCYCVVMEFCNGAEMEYQGAGRGNTGIGTNRRRIQL
jgi:hypothetical protein